MTRSGSSLTGGTNADRAVIGAAVVDAVWPRAKLDARKAASASESVMDGFGNFMVAVAQPEANSRMKRRRAPPGAIRDACCFLRRHDPFQVRRVEQPSVPQSQSSAEDTPTGNPNAMRIAPLSKPIRKPSVYAGTKEGYEICRRGSETDHEHIKCSWICRPVMAMQHGFSSKDDARRQAINLAVPSERRRSESLR